MIFTDLVDYHVHPGTLHAKSIVGPGRISTMYRGHYINLSQDCEYNLYMKRKKTVITFNMSTAWLLVSHCPKIAKKKIALYTVHKIPKSSVVQKG